MPRLIAWARTISGPAAVAVLAAILGLGLAIRLAFVHDPGYPGDLDIFASWLKTATTSAPGDFYAKATPDFNYPPASAAIFMIEAALVRHFGGTFANVETVREAVKLPAILADLLCGIIAFDIVRRLAGRSSGLAAAALTVFNPTSIYISAFWGQFDAIPVAFALGALQQVLFGSATVAWPLLTIGMLIKPQIVLLTPILGMAALGPAGFPFQKRRFYAHVGGLVISALIAEILAVTFFPHRSAFGAALTLLQQIHSRSSYYAQTSLNAFNFWALFWDFFASDGTRFLGLKLHVWGVLAFAAFALAIYARFAVVRTRKSLLEASALVMLAFFCILTEIHERYIYFALPLFALLIFDRRYAIGSAILALTALFNIEYAYTALVLSDANVTAVKVNEFAPMLVHLCSLANVGLFVWLFVDFLGVLPRSLASAAPLGERMQRSAS